MQATRAVPDRAHAAIGRNHGVQRAQRVQFATGCETASRQATRRRTVQHDHDRTAMVVMLAAEIEQTIHGGAADAALLHPRFRMA